MLAACGLLRPFATRWALDMAESALMYRHSAMDRGRRLTAAAGAAQRDPRVAPVMLLGRLGQKCWVARSEPPLGSAQVALGFASGAAPGPPAPAGVRYVTLRYEGMDFTKERNLELEDGRLDMAIVEAVFGARMVELLVDGMAIVPSVFPPGQRKAGLTRSTFTPGQTIKIKVTKRDDAAAAFGPRSTRYGDDITAAYLKACLTPLDGNKLRYGEDLECLEQPLEPRLPLLWEYAVYLFNEDSRLRDLLVSVAEEPQAATPRKLGHHVGNVVVHGPCDGTSETHTAGRMLDVVEKTLTLIRDSVPGPIIRMARNTCDTAGATDKRLQPDFMCWVNNALLFKGEERASEDEFYLAVEELGDKFTAAWDEGLLPGVSAPCMLAYAAAGHLMQFFCIKRWGGAGKPLVQPISTVMDLRRPIGRARAITATCNVYRMMVGLAETKLDTPFLPLGDVSSNGQSSVLLLQGYVRKTITKFSRNHADFTTFELLQAMYAAISKPEHKDSIIQACGPGSDGGPTLRNDNYVVNLSPVGVPVDGPPRTERMLARAVQGVLTGLAALHSEGFVHRDVRWANLIELRAEGRWLLMDMEHGGRDGDNCSRPPYPLRYWSSNTLAPNGTYTAASDLKMLAKQLMSVVPFQLSGEGRDLRQRLRDGAVSAVDALQHSWFTTHA